MRHFLAGLAFLAASSASWAQGVDAMSSILLVAKKDMRDPFFRDSVVLVTHRLGLGPVGLIMNRPTDVEVASAVPGAAKRSKSERMFFGGPVQPTGVAVLFRMKDPPAEATEVLAGVFLTMNRETITELLARDPPVKDLRFFAGYAGWGFGQLENEVKRGDWHLVRADAETLFDRNPATLWRDLERRSGGKATGFPAR